MPYDPQKYGPVFESLLSVKSIPPLGIGHPDIFRQSQIVGNTLEALFLRNEIRDFDMARCCHAGIMIFNSFLDPARQLLVHISSNTSDYWQGILARREMKPDEAAKFFNSFAHHPRLHTDGQGIQAVGCQARKLLYKYIPCMGCRKICQLLQRTGRQRLSRRKALPDNSTGRNASPLRLLL
jgi:hypothetical protein